MKEAETPYLIRDSLDVRCTEALICARSARRAHADQLRRSAATRAAVTSCSTALCDQLQRRMRRRIGTASVRDRVPGAEGRNPRSSQPNLRKVLGGGHPDVPHGGS